MEINIGGARRPGLRGSLKVVDDFPIVLRPALLLAKRMECVRLAGAFS